MSATDDPLFSSDSRTTSQSSRTNSPVSNDPLTRPSSSNGRLDISSSTPISTSPRRANAKTSGSLSPGSNSIFGDIDVSKLGTINGHSKRVSNTSLRSTATLRSSKQYDLEDEEDLLFGGKSISRNRVNSKTSPDASIHKKSPMTTHTTLPPKKHEDKNPSSVVIPTPRKSTPPPPAVVTPAIIKQVEQPTITKPTEKPQEKTTEEKPTSSSSFFRFFKSNTTQSKPSSSASSAASVNAPSSPVVSTEGNDTIKTPIPVSAPPSHRQKTMQPQPRTVGKKQQHVVAEQEEEEEDDDQVQRHQIIDEATRAFADDVMTFKPTMRPALYFAPELTMDALTIDTPPNKKLIPSVSTPTATTVDDPWSNLRQPILLNGPIEPSISSPLAVKEQDIEPQKRAAFADLIASWNTGGGQQQMQQSTTTSEDPDQFFSHVAEEKRDIGFSGIHEDEIEERNDIIVDWVQAEENPWN